MKLFQRHAIELSKKDQRAREFERKTWSISSNGVDHTVAQQTHNVQLNSFCVGPRSHKMVIDAIWDEPLKSCLLFSDLSVDNNNNNDHTMPRDKLGQTRSCECLNGSRTASSLSLVRSLTLLWLVCKLNYYIEVVSHGSNYRNEDLKRPRCCVQLDRHCSWRSR